MNGERFRMGERRATSRELVETDLKNVACPCGGTFSLTHDAVSGVPAIVHTLPTCPAFLQLEPADYLVHVRRTS